jgi:hypothetical protein
MRREFGEYEGRATRRRDTCIVWIAVRNANPVGVLAVVSQRQRRRHQTGRSVRSAEADTELRATPMTGQFLVNCEHVALSAQRVRSRA